MIIRDVEFIILKNLDNVPDFSYFWRSMLEDKCWQILFHSKYDHIAMLIVTKESLDKYEFLH